MCFPSARSKWRMASYTRVVVHYPYMVFLVVFVVIATCLVLSLTLVEFPTFGNPLDGFEPRGTEIGQRLNTFGNIYDNKGNKLSLLPSNFHSLLKDIDDSDAATNEQNQTDRLDKRSTKNNDYFCEYSSQKYSQFAHIAFTADDSSNLFTAENIRQMCYIEEQIIRTHSSFNELCLTKTNNECCPSWSLGNYISRLSQKSNCSQITQEDVNKVYKTLDKCSPYYFNYTLEHDCEATKRSGKVYSRCKGIPRRCIRFNGVFNILHHITDMNFIPESAKPHTQPFLRYAITFLPISYSIDTVELYNHIESWVGSSNQNIKIAGIDFGIKYTLFSEYLLKDTIWIIGAICVIFILVWIYTASIFVTIMTFVVIGSSLVMSYFLNQIIFEIKFFPYMNLVTAVMVIAIGADDVFVYCKVWHLSKSERNNGTMEKIVHDTLHHATLSMFVTSLTTSAALFSNGASSITAIKCFSIYAGTTILCNFLIMITLIPATLIINDKWCNCESWYNPEFSSNQKVSYFLCKIPYKVYHSISDWSRIFFEKLLPFIIVKFRYIWIFILGALGIGGVVVIFFHPKLKLPSSDKFQVFSSDHLIEKYEFQIRNNFRFEKSKDIEEFTLLPLTFVWGAFATDKGDYLDPASRGSLKFDKTFNAITQSAQTWLLQFCNKLKNTDFYQQTPGYQLTNCFFDKFRDYLQKPCLFVDDFPCCNNTYPKSEEMSYCLYKYIPMLMNTPGVQYSQMTPGIRYTDNSISLLIVEYMSNVQFSFSYSKTKDFYTKVNSWFTQELQSAPPEMKNGWFVSNLAMFDLQNSLSEETPITMGISLCVVAAVIFITTLNVFISIFALISVACIMFVTIGTLVLLNWELNILEAVILTVALGMSVDYTLHYAVVYRLSPDIDRENKIVSCVHSMGSVITMAAITTFLAGALMMPATVLVYKKFGIFLMLVISVSWTYSTIFFLSLLCICGPMGNFGQFKWPTCEVCVAAPEEHQDKTQYTISELSSTSTYPHTTSTATTSTSESRELESISDDPIDPFPLPQRRRSRSRGQYHEYMKARTRSDSPEELRPGRAEGYHSRRGSRVRFSIGSIEKTSPSHEIDTEPKRYGKRRSVAEDSVFEVSEESLSSPVEGSKTEAH
ncbi:protein dispatched homolog 1-like isoform X1 [Mytilus trossulus]|uniref:protein dispatched homolog 1-like isoform X1 n=1 Tax=Mytilus trossulus TaxID=6551 RepID=UPI0030054858